MRPIISWIVLVDAETVRIVVNEGPGKGLYGRKTDELKARAVTELSDAPGMTASSVGPNRGSISDPQLKAQAEALFANEIATYLDNALQDGEFDRLVLAAAPEMLGLLRQRLSNEVKGVLLADLAKDLTHVTLEDLPAHLSNVLVV